MKQPNRLPYDPETYTIPITFSSSDPGDLQTLYFGMVGSPMMTTPGNFKIYFPTKGRITKIMLSTYSNLGAGTAEDISVYFRLNNTTEWLVQLVALATGTREYINRNLNIPVTTADYGEMKMVCPTWGTNPTGMRGGGYIYVEVP